MMSAREGIVPGTLSTLSTRLASLGTMNSGAGVDAGADAQPLSASTAPGTMNCTTFRMRRSAGQELTEVSVRLLTCPFQSSMVASHHSM
jgi:hypothetical protein